MLHSLIQRIADLPPAGIYLVIGLLAALENIFPPVPADTAAALGGFLAAQNPRLSVLLIYVVTIVGNIGSAAGVYLFARRVGKGFLASRLGRRLVSPELMTTVKDRYERHHVWGIFVSRCLPVYRAVVPPVAGMMEVPARRAIPAMAAASALFYGAVVWLAYTLGSNWSVVEAAVGRMGRVLLGLAVLVTVLLLWLWSRWRERRGR